MHSILARAGERDQVRVRSIGQLSLQTERHSHSVHPRSPGPHELRPSDILIERFSAWKRLVKNLITYFEGIADIEVSIRPKPARAIADLI